MLRTPLSASFSGTRSGSRPFVAGAWALLLSAALASAAEPEESLRVAPLDPAVVAVEGLPDLKPLASAKLRRQAPAPGARVARAFHPVFGAAVSLAARRVDVVDSSAAASVPSPVATTVAREAHPDRAFDSASVSIPAFTSDSARYTLALGRLAFGESSRMVPRRFVQPTTPSFDPATGRMDPGQRKGYAEGPGRETTLTARAAWAVWDHLGDSAVASGIARAETAFRGSAGRSDWDALARDLAKSVLRATPFTPF